MRARHWWFVGATAVIAVALIGWLAPRETTGPARATAPAARPAPAASTPPQAAVRPASAPSAAVPASALTVPTRGLDFDSASDLYALANAAANSTDPMTVHNGRHAALACRMARARTDLEALANGGPADAEGQERQRAARLLLSRCAGFFDNDPAANNELLRRLRDRLASFGEEYIPGVTPGGPTDRQLATAIERGDWQTFLFGAPAARVVARVGLANDAPEAQTLGVAMLMAQCDLGQDCTPDGLLYAIQCTYATGQCAGSWAAFNRRGMTPAQYDDAQRRAAEIVAAFRRKDLAYFGIGGAPAKP